MTTANIERMVTEDARKTATEWLEMGKDAALFMVTETIAATHTGEPLPEPAEMARESLRSYLTNKEIDAAWPTFIRALNRSIQFA